MDKVKILPSYNVIIILIPLNITYYYVTCDHTYYPHCHILLCDYYYCIPPPLRLFANQSILNSALIIPTCGITGPRQGWAK